MNGLCVRWAALGVFSFLIQVPAHADLIITPTFDPTLSNPTVQATINAAIQTYEGLFTNPIDVQIYFQSGSPLGQNDYFASVVTYQSFYDGLMATDANPAAFAALNANGGDADTNGGRNPVTGNMFILAKSANLRAVGINQAPDCQLGTPGAGGIPHDCSGNSGPAYDAIISLNTSITSPPLSLDGNYGLLSTVEHEIDEVLGIGSSLVNCAQSNNPNAACSSGNITFANDTQGTNAPMPEDLYRWNATGGRSPGTNCNAPTSAFFSYGPSTGQIAQFDNSCDGGDFGDWQQSGTPLTQDAFATPGANPTLGAKEIAALTAIGYTINAEVPEPGTALFPLALAVLAYWKRCSAKKAGSFFRV